MWYFSWIVGLPFAVLFAVVMGIWFDIREKEDQQR